MWRVTNVISDVERDGETRWTGRGKKSEARYCKSNLYVKAGNDFWKNNSKLFTIAQPGKGTIL